MADDHPLHVLLIEDDEADAFVVGAHLSEPAVESYRLTVAPTLAAAAPILAASPPPDVVLLDLGLPDGRGAENVSVLRSVSDAVPIVVITGADDEALAYACIDAGAQDFLWKGELRATSLRRAIRHAVTRHRESAERIGLERQLREALTKALGGFVPICSHCKSIRDEEKVWIPIETYLARHGEIETSHGICPDCIRRLYPDDYVAILRDIEHGRRGTPDDA